MLYNGLTILIGHGFGILLRLCSFLHYGVSTDADYQPAAPVATAPFSILCNKHQFVMVQGLTNWRQKISAIAC